MENYIKTKHEVEKAERKELSKKKKKTLNP